jgi:hypothetical protein
VRGYKQKLSSFLYSIPCHAFSGHYMSRTRVPFDGAVFLFHGVVLIAERFHCQCFGSVGSVAVLVAIERLVVISVAPLDGIVQAVEDALVDGVLVVAGLVGAVGVDAAVTRQEGAGVGGGDSVGVGGRVVKLGQGGGLWREDEGEGAGGGEEKKKERAHCSGIEGELRGN